MLRRGFRPLAAGLAAIAIIAVVLRLIAPGAFVAAAAPISRAGAGFAEAVSGFFAVFHDHAALADERDAAREQAAAFSEENAALSAQVADLTRLLGSRSESRDTILAGVLLRPPESPYDTLVVDQGSDAGVTVGAAAYGAGGVPIGAVSSVTRMSARIALYSAPLQETAGWMGDDREPLTLIGLGGGAFYAEAPREASTTIGEAVYAPGPGALPIGTVARIDSDPSSPKAVVRVRGTLNLFSITWVTIARGL